MAQRFLTDMGDALDAAGIPWVGVGPSSLDPTGASGWQTRGRPMSTGDFEPMGVLCHHTASPAGTSPQADLNVILAGNSGAPGPISQVLIGRDAVVQLVAAGRANHGGSGMRPGLDSSCTDMNARLVGLEVSNNGIGEWWPDDQTEVYARVVAALCSWYGWPLDHVWLHATTGPPAQGCNSKIDPAGPWCRQPGLVGSTTWDLDVWRAFVAEHAGGAPDPNPPTQGGLVLTILQCSDAWAAFLGFTWLGIGHDVRWITGDEKAMYAGLGVPEQSITVEQCANLVLLGSLPQGDQAHGWTGAEFHAVCPSS